MRRAGAHPEPASPLTRAEDLRSLAIARAVFTEVTPQLLLDVDAVLAGRPVPTMSHVDR